MGRKYKLKLLDQGLGKPVEASKENAIDAIEWAIWAVIASTRLKKMVRP